MGVKTKGALMQIIIPLPKSDSTNTYEELKSYLKQFELAVHYAQKSVESAEKEGIKLTEDCFVDFRYSSFEQNFIDEHYDDLQHVELNINLE